jgi:hypothetical protein
MKEQPKCDLPGAYLDQYADSGKWMWWLADGRLCNAHGEHKPRYRVGETVYVKEMWYPAKYSDWEYGVKYKGSNDIHKLEKNQPEWEKYYDKPPLWKNKMFMPEWASRCKLEITGVGAERLQDISAEDAIKEGVSTNLREHDAVCDLRAKFSNLIDRINGVGAWDSNHWCWVYEFRRVS